MSMEWGDFWKGAVQSGVKTAMDYQVADSARDNHLGVPENNMFTAIPENHTQQLVPSQTPSGQPIFQRLFYQKGKLNPLAVGGAVIVALLVLKRR